VSCESLLLDCSECKGVCCPDVSLDVIVGSFQHVLSVVAAGEGGDAGDGRYAGRRDLGEQSVHWSVLLL
jgi:hypothetical protein